MEELRHERFQLQARLGRGGMGVVYRAVDKAAGTVIALKTLTNMSAESLLRFKREFRVLAELHHPNLVRLGELHHVDERWFFTMELVNGVDVVRYVRDAPSDPGARREEPDEVGPPPMEVIAERIRVVLPQLVAAIDAVHRAGQVHRDIKPSNVLVEPSGRVVLVDFGIVGDSRVQDVSATRAGLVVGTPIYMSPEQATGERAGPPADWYSLGVVLFELLTGTVPYSGPDALVGFKKLSYAAPRAREIAPGVPEDLDELCARLLERAPEARPDAPQILELLDADRDRTEDLGAPATIRRFVGRTAELAVLREAFDGARAGRCVVVAIRGDPGIGKTALATRALELVARSDPGAITLRARCYEHEAVPFAAVDALVDALAVQLGKLTSADIGYVLGGGLQFLGEIFPVLGGLHNVEPNAERLGGPAELPRRRRRAFDELREVLIRLASMRLVIMVIDDLQWADPETLELLAYLLRSPGAPTCAVVATLREEEAHHVDLERLSPTVEILEVAGLDETASRALLYAAWAELQARRPMPESMEGAVEQTGGHPLFLLEMVRYAASHPNMVRPPSLLDALWQRVQGLPPNARRLVEVCSLVGVPAPLNALAAAAEIDAHETLKVVGQLRAAQLVRVTRVDGQRMLEPYHNRLREAVLDHLSETSGALTGMLQRHLRIGRSLLASSTGSHAQPPRADAEASISKDPEVFTVLRHLDLAHTLLASSEDLLELARLHLAAADQARTATAWNRARHHFQRGVESIGDEAWEVNYPLCKALNVGLMEAEYLTGSEDRAWARYRRMKARIPHEGEKVALAVKVIALETAVGRFDQALALGHKEVGRLGVELPADTGTIDLIRETLSVSWQRMNLAPGDIARLPELADRRMQHALRLMVAMTPAALFEDTSLLLVILMRIAGISLRHGVTAVSAYGFAGYGAVLAAAHQRYGEARALGDAALALNERYGNQGLEAQVRMIRGAYIVPWTSTVRAARAELERGASVARTHGDSHAEVYNLAVQAMLDLCAGEPIDQVEEHVRTALATAVGRKLADIEAMLRALLSFYDQLRERPAPQAGRDPARTQRRPFGSFYEALLAAELAWIGCRYEQAAEWMEHARERARVVVGQPVWVELQWVGALVDARMYELPGVMRRFNLRRRIAATERILARAAASTPSYRAAALLVKGERLRLEGWHKAADAAMERAAQAGSPKHQAMATECRAQLARARGQTEKAGMLLVDAAEAYRRWGASGKARDLRVAGEASKG